MNNHFVTVTPNPAIDKTAVVHQFQVGEIHRPETLLTLPGGKGLNVARALKTLGAPVRACVLVGGYAGDWIVSELHHEGIAVTATKTSGETRTCLSIIDQTSGQITEVYENSLPLEVAVWDQFEADIKQSLVGAKSVSFSGSLPENAPADGYARLITVAKSMNITTFLDTHGAALQHALPASPDVIKVNLLEFNELLKEPVEALEDLKQAAMMFAQTHDIARIVITMGAQGALGYSVEDNETLFATVPKRKILSAVGSGDSFLAGTMIGLSSFNDMQLALRLAVAAGTANTLKIGAAQFDLDSVSEIQHDVYISTKTSTIP